MSRSWEMPRSCEGLSGQRVHRIARWKLPLNFVSLYAVAEKHGHQNKQGSHDKRIKLGHVRTQHTGPTKRRQVQKGEGLDVENPQQSRNQALPFPQFSRSINVHRMAWHPQYKRERRLEEDVSQSGGMGSPAAIF